VNEVYLTVCKGFSKDGASNTRLRTPSKVSLHLIDNSVALQGAVFTIVEPFLK